MKNATIVDILPKDIMYEKRNYVPLCGRDTKSFLVPVCDF